jgi:phosphoribosylformylglycinamidine cyclo-ligase
VRTLVEAAWPGTGSVIGGFAGRAVLPRGTHEIGCGTDGAGTAAMLAGLLAAHLPSGGKYLNAVGQSAAAMSIADVYCGGSWPRYVLDTVKTGRLVPELHLKVVEGIVTACLRSGCRLIGGETAEMPGLYRYPWYLDVDVVAVGTPLVGQPFSPAYVAPGQTVYGWLSYGPGANGLSLIRRVFHLDERPAVALRTLTRRWSELGGATLADAVVRPTMLYVREMESERLAGVGFVGHAHITGGGFVDNIPRILPPGCKVVIDRSTWPRPPLFDLVQRRGRVNDAEMQRVFNNGLQVVSIVREGKPTDLRCLPVGRVERRRRGEPQVEFTGRWGW